MKLKKGQKVIIRTSDEIRKRMEKTKDYKLIENTNFRFFDEHGNKEGVICNNIFQGDVIVSILDGSSYKLRIESDHVPYAFKFKPIDIKLNENLFKI